MMKDYALRKKTEELMESCDKVMNSAFEASGQTFMESMESMDATTGAIIGGCMEMYRLGKDLADMQALMLDDVASTLMDLDRRSKEQQKMLQDIYSMLYTKTNVN